jgi:hypothetical protein
MRFSEPWELSSIVATVVIEIDVDDVILDEPIVGRVVAADFDDSLVGRSVEIRPRLSGDRKPLSDSPIVNLAVEVEPSKWRGLGFGKLARLLPPTAR